MLTSFFFFFLFFLSLLISFPCIMDFFLFLSFWNAGDKGRKEGLYFLFFWVIWHLPTNLHMFCQVKDEFVKLCGKGFRFFAESGGTHGTLFHPKDYSQIHCWCCSHHVLCACHVYFPRRRDTDGIEVPWGTGILDWGGVLKFRYPVCPCAGVVRKFKTLFGSQEKRKEKKRKKGKNWI